MYTLAIIFFFFKQKTAYEMRISDWSSDVCSSDLCTRSYRWKMAEFFPRCNAEFCADVIVDLCIQVQTHIVLLVPGGRLLVIAVLVLVAQRGQVFNILGSSADLKIMLLLA